MGSLSLRSTCPPIKADLHKPKNVYPKNTFMTTRFGILLVVFSFCAPLYAQSWKKMEKTADGFFQKGDYAQAAAMYENALKKKNNKALSFKAGESYYLLRDFRKAAQAYESIKNDNASFPLIGLKYARSLKQDGRYEEAAKAFQNFRDTYTGEGKMVLEEIVQIELRGCDLAKNMTPQEGVEEIRPGNTINTADNEFAPVSITPDVLFFSSTMGGQARIYRSDYLGLSWGKSTTPPNFPLIQNGQYCHGSLAPDGSRFYFTICENKGKFDNLTTRCEIFVIRKLAQEGWSSPERLPDYINTNGVTATQPWVTYRGDVEILYFASNRSGGKGGMDLWYVTRNLNSDAGFSQPVNLGPGVNTQGHEMTPYYSTEEGSLYFASNGLPSLGGFDLFKTKGDLANWSSPDNIGKPFNSQADELYLVKTNEGNTIFLSSNRSFGSDKTTNRDDDIFEFRVKPKALLLEGAAFDQELGEPMRSYNLSLFEVQSNGNEILLLSRILTDGNYTLEVLPQRQYRVEVNAEGYESGSYTFFTDNPSNQSYGQPLFLRKMGAPKPNPIPVTPTPTPEKPSPAINAPVVPFPVGETYTLRGTSNSDNLEYQSNAPRHNGIYYKIQLVAASKYNPTDPSFSKLSALGVIQTEYIPSRSLTRILLADFMSVAEAKNALAEAKKKGFSAAYIVKYENGVRYGKTNL